MKNKFGIINIPVLYLHQFFKILIKKDGGKWPCEVLATILF